MRVLVVEDEPAIAGQLASALGAAGYAVDCAADGAQADFLVRTETYDAVVLDLGLPRVDGLTILHGWRASGLQVPVLVLTARGAWHEVTRDGIPIRLTSLEFRVLSYLMHNQTRVVPQAELIEHIYARDEDRDSNTVEVFVGRLRRKLGASVIETHRGLGYRMAPR